MIMVEIGKPYGFMTRKVTIISAGTTVGHCVKAAANLEEDGIDVGLLNMHTVKPLDSEAIAQAVEISDMIFVVEEHTRIGGLGSAISDHIVENHGTGFRLFCHGIDDRYVETETIRFCCRKTGLMPLVSKILSI